MRIKKYFFAALTLVILIYIVSFLLRRGNPLEENKPELYSGPEIHLAAIQGNIEKIRTILNETPELLNQTDRYGNTPLHLAAYKGHGALVKFLISKEVNVNKENNFGGTALLLASYAGQAEIVKMLLSSGTDANSSIRSTEDQVLQIASLEGYRDYSHMYNAQGGIINLRVHFIATSLQASAVKCHREIVEILIENGADVNASPTGHTALHSAAVNGHKELVELLIAHGAEVDARNQMGHTPLCSALFMSMEPVDLNSIYDTVKVLIEKGADVNATTRRHLTPLHFAAGWANKETVELLLAAGADINAKDDDGDTPLNVACRYRLKRPGGVIDLLHKHGAVRRHGKNNSYKYEPDLISGWL
jgi:ankyrin repeat protein